MRLLYACPPSGKRIRVDETTSEIALVAPPTMAVRDFKMPPLPAHGLAAPYPNYDAEQ